jgi:hypothetical protein
MYIVDGAKDHNHAYQEIDNMHHVRENVLMDGFLVKDHV